MSTLGYTYNDGGRDAAGFKGEARDCVARAIAIFTGRDYREVYRHVAAFERRYGKRGVRSARNGVCSKARERAMAHFGLTKIKLPPGPCPTYAQAHEAYGDCIVSTNGHIAALVNGALQDTFDGRTYEWEDCGPVVTKERKARSVWIKG